MPELPEVAALTGFLDGHPPGAVVTKIQIASFAVLKTANPPFSELEGRAVARVRRFGKFVSVDADGLYFVFHLVRAGGVCGPGSVRHSRNRGARTGSLQPRVRRRCLGADPWVQSPANQGRPEEPERYCRHRNAYSDEILHAARLSPFAVAKSLDRGAVQLLYDPIHSILGTALREAGGKPPHELKDIKRTHLGVRARTGEVCPVCGDIVREVSFADTALQYCPNCQTKGKILADRRTSRFLK